MSKNPQDTNRVTEENIGKLREKLRELFQLDRGDLDFGLYRIMALKRAEITDFLDNKLLPQVSEALGEIARSDRAMLEARRDELVQELEKAQIHEPEVSPKFGEYQAQIKAAKSDEQTEAETYNHLCNFFSRYYDEGDFMSLRRYKSGGKEAYSIPYNGEEVKLHWANADQYYIKTTENYASYVFKIGEGKKERRVRFEIAAADNEKDNIKEASDKQRLFVLAKKFVAEQDKELIIHFDHRPLSEGEKKIHSQNGARRQASINAESEKRIFGKLKGDYLHSLSAPCPTEADETRTLLGKHIAAYTAKNSFDYFIHKDLGGFLRRELDHYLKSEVISIDNLELTDDPIVFMRGLAQIKAIKWVGNKIIDFLAQLEDFQKKLWLKKKFVLDTHYCVTLDKIPQSFYGEIVENKAQHDEWVELFAIDKMNGDLVSVAYSQPLKPDFLQENPYLVLDTRHFDRGFTDRLLAALSENAPIDEQMNGLLVHGENFQALNLLQERYRGRVQCVYIDPPYNAPNSEIVYKNNYKHSSFLSLIEGRLSLSRNLSSTDGSHVVAIDKNERSGVFHMLCEIFPINDNVEVTIEHNRKGVQADHFSFTHEYALFSIPSTRKTLNAMQRPEAEWDFSNFRNWGGESRRTDAANCFYAVFVRNKKIIGFGDVWTDVALHPAGSNVKREDGIIEIYPIDNDGVERKWRYDRSTVESIKNRLRVDISRNDILQVKIAKTTDQFKTVWYSPRYNAGENGTRLVREMDVPIKEFDYPKSIFTTRDCVFAISDPNAFVLDYFAGSGTTGHAVINLNREDNGNRKYILVEVGHHFETVLLPRLKKAVYSTDWKDGKPQGREGVSQLFKYVRLESYEDTLDSLILKSAHDLVAKTEQEEFIEDYQLRYALGEETAGSASLVGKKFIEPFRYTLSVVRDGVRRDAHVDLAETFNFLLGLRLAARREIDGVLTITGINANDEHCLILWRNLKKMNATKLNEWFGKHRKTFGGGLDLIYVNGDHTLNALRKSKDKWEAVATELVFRELMFEEVRDDG